MPADTFNRGNTIIMLHRLLSNSTGVALMALGTLAAPHAGKAATLTAGSSASAVSASFVVNGKTGKLAPQLVASGSGSTAYNSTVSKPSLKASQTFDILTLSATVNNIKDSASSAGAKAGTIASVSGAQIGSFSGTIGSPLGNALTASASKLVSSAGLTKTAATNTATGAATLTNLSIVSSFFGINKSYTGSPKPNTILYQSNDKTVTIYLNRQVKKSAGGKVASIAVSAVNLHIVNFQNSGQTISGDLYLASSNAN